MSSEDHKMSVDAEWVLLEDGDSIEDCLAGYPEAGLVALPVSAIEERDGLDFEIDGVPRPSHGGVFRVDGDGNLITARMSSGVKRYLKKNASWVVPLPEP